jgi:hypothetical protein
MELLIALAIFAAGFVAGWFRATNSLIEKLVTDPQGMIAILKTFQQSLDTATEETSLREVKIETVNNYFYIYDKESNDFLAQGATVEEAMLQIEQRFPNKKFIKQLSDVRADQLDVSVKQ